MDGKLKIEEGKDCQ